MKKTKRRKKLLSLFLTALLVLSVLPVTAFAAESTESDLPSLGIGKTKLETGYYLLKEDGTLGTGSPEKYNIYCDVGNGTAVKVTLKNADVKGTLYVPGNTTIKLEGKNTITADTCIRVWTDGDVTLKPGSGAEVNLKATGKPIVVNSGSVKVAEGCDVFAGTDDKAPRISADKLTAATYTDNHFIRIQSHVHSIVAVEANAATCTEDGNKAYWKCSVCEKLFSDPAGTTEITLADTVAAKTGHDYDAPVFTWAEDGKTCTVTFTCKNDSEHKTIQNAVVTSMVKTAATCTENGTTSYTAAVTFEGKSYMDTKDIEDITAAHSLTAVPAKAATCTEDGNKAYWICNTCGKLFLDQAGTTETTLADTVIAKLGHSYKDGTCSVCGAADPDYKKTSDKTTTSTNKTTNTNKTTTTKKTSTANKTTSAKKTSTSSKTTAKTTNKGKITNTKTGDNSNAGLWVALMAASGFCVIGTTVYSKKRIYQR